MHQFSPSTQHLVSSFAFNFFETFCSQPCDPCRRNLHRQMAATFAASTSRSGQAGDFIAQLPDRQHQGAWNPRWHTSDPSAQTRLAFLCVSSFHLRFLFIQDSHFLFLYLHFLESTDHFCKFLFHLVFLHYL